MMNIGSMDGTFARVVTGIDLWHPLPDSERTELASAWSTHGVLIFRRQVLDESELLAFSRSFGEPARIVRSDWQADGCPEVTIISNLKNQHGRSIGGLGAGELGWHTDQSYVMNPATGCLLHMIERPARGGRTYWANLQLAYEAMPDALLRRVEGRHAVHDYVARQRTYDDEATMTEALRQRTPPVTHPLVQQHPVTGRRSLYLDPTSAVGVLGMPDTEARSLLDEVTAHATQPEFVYAHEWQVGDVVMWDNGIVLHRRDEFPADSIRLLKRTTLWLSPTTHLVPETALAGV